MWKQHQEMHISTVCFNWDTAIDPKGLYINTFVDSFYSFQNLFCSSDMAMRFHTCRFYPPVRLSLSKYKLWQMRKILTLVSEPFLGFWSSQTVRPPLNC